MAIRGIREKIVFVHNPLPNVTDSELLKLADLEMMEGASRPILFSWTWKYSGGLDAETIRLAPGEFTQLRESEAAVFLKEFREQGAVITESDDEKTIEVRKAEIEGLQRAHQFYKDRGMKRETEWRKAHGVGKEEADESRYDRWTYRRNQAAADLIEQHITKLRSPAAPAAKK